MNAFLFVFDPSEIDRDIVVKRIDRIAAVSNWYAFFGNTMCLAAECDVKELSQSIRAAFPDLKFVVTEVDPERKDGWLPRSIWTFMNAPVPAEAETA